MPDFALFLFSLTLREPSQMTKISHTIYQSPLSQALKVDQIPGYDYQLESRITTVSEKVAVPFLCRFLGQDKYPKRFDFAFMHARCLEKLLDIPRGDVDSAKSKGELAELFTTHASSKGSLNLLENSDIVVVPSPLLFAGMRGYQPTYVCLTCKAKVCRAFVMSCQF
jgi:hypothetical protein